MPEIPEADGELGTMLTRKCIVSTTDSICARGCVNTLLRMKLWYNKTIFKAGNGRMAIHTMIEL